MIDEAAQTICHVCWRVHSDRQHEPVPRCRCGHRRVEHNELALDWARIGCVAGGCECARYEP